MCNQNTKKQEVRRGATVNRNRNSFVSELEGGKKKAPHSHLGVQVDVCYIPLGMLAAPMVKLV